MVKSQQPVTKTASALKKITNMYMGTSAVFSSITANEINCISFIAELVHSSAVVCKLYSLSCHHRNILYLHTSTTQLTTHVCYNSQFKIYALHPNYSFRMAYSHNSRKQDGHHLKCQPVGLCRKDAFWNQ